MKVFIDTNIIIDFLLNRGNEVESVVTIFQLGNAGYFDLVISDLSVANIAYITRKDIPHETFISTMKNLQHFLSVVPLGSVVVNKALDAAWNDFEDSLQYFSAIQADADCIITRNIKDFQKANLPVFTPSQFLHLKQ